MNRKATGHTSSLWNLHFLSWLDALEKLDILVLEIRHLQHTCIYSLREPALHTLLEKEEVLLDPLRSKESERLAFFEALVPCFQGRDHLETARALVKEFVPAFPPLFTDKQEKPLPSAVRERLHQIWSKGVWSDSNKDLYHVLKASQQVKRQILADRITLFLEGYDALKFSAPPHVRVSETASLPELFLLRVSILSRSHNYLQRIGDLQQRLAQHLESAPAQYPRPSVHRRRMQGTYTQYLADRSAYLRQSMNLLLASLRSNRNVPLPCPMIFHRWEHSHTSRQDVFLDEVEKSGSVEGQDLLTSSATDRVEFVQTGFWMLDKPDNQPILAHEVAHHAIRQHYHGLHPHYLATAGRNDSFAHLLMRLTKALDSFQVPRDPESWTNEMELISVLEIACDLLALGVKGISYLYAFFLEAVGWGLEHAMVDDHGYVPHLNVRLELRRRFDAPRVKDLRDWYIRGRILVAWARATGNVNTTLDKELCEGLETFLTQLSERLDDATIFREFRSGDFWSSLADRLCVIVRHSKAATCVKAWRKERRGDTHSVPEMRRFHRGAQRLPLDLRHFLVKVITSEKFRFHGDYDEFIASLPSYKQSSPDLLSSLSWRYGIIEDWSKITDTITEETVNELRTLFRHTFDIPWQSAWLHAIDHLNCPEAHANEQTGLLLADTRRVANLYIDLNRNSSLGRDLFFVAVEVHGLASQSPGKRIRAIIRELHRAVQTKESSPSEALTADIADWLVKAQGALERETSLMNEGRFEEARRVQWEQGELLKEFLRCMEKRDNNATELAETNLWETVFEQNRASHLAYYIRARDGKENGGLRDYYKRLTSYFNVGSTEEKVAAPAAEASIRLALASRASVAGNLSLDRDDCDNPLTQLYAGVLEAGKGESGVATCGYYNALLIKDDIKLLCRCVLPALRVKDSESKIKAPIFMRRETWITLRRLSKQAAQADEETPTPKDLSNAIGIIFVQLHRRFARLDYVDWIYEGRGQEDLRLSSSDKIYLTDGWADVVLVISDRGMDGKERRKEDFFSIQDAVVSHFLVRRIESVATARWFDLKGKLEHSVYVSVRLDDVSPKRTRPERFVELCKNSRDDADRPINPEILSMPGSTDITLRFDVGPDKASWLTFIQDSEKRREIDRLLVQVCQHHH